MSTLYKRGKTWHCDFRVNGLRIRESLKTGDKDLATRRLLARQEELAFRDIENLGESDMKFSEACERWYRWAETHLEPGSIIHVRNSIARFFDVYDDVYIRQMGPDLMDAYKNNRLKHGNSKETINGHLKDFSTIINRAIKQRWYSGRNPLANVQRFKIRWTEPEFHTEVQRDRLLEVSKSFPWYLEATVLLGGWQGLRKKEMSFARWEWFRWDDERPVIWVKGHSEFRVKDHEDRPIPMHPMVRDFFYSRRQESGYLFPARQGNSGKAVYRFDCKRSMISTLERSGLTVKVPFHRLRDTFGSIAVQKGIPIKKVSRWMGHSSVVVTERKYVGLEIYDEDIKKI